PGPERSNGARPSDRDELGDARELAKVAGRRVRVAGHVGHSPADLVLGRLWDMRVGLVGRPGEDVAHSAATGPPRLAGPLGVPPGPPRPAPDPRPPTRA